VYGLFDAMAAHLFLWNTQLDRPDGSHGSRTYLGQQEALNYYLRIDPRRVALMRQPVGYTLLCHEHIDEAFVRGSEFFQDYSLRYGRRYLMATSLLETGRSTSVLALLRSPQQGPFGLVEKSIFERLRPHLVRILQMQTRLERLRAEASLGNDLLNAVQTCFVAADAGARVVRMNQAMEDVLHTGDVMQLVSGRLAATTPAQTANLQRLIRQASGAEGAIRGGSIIINARQGSRHAVAVMPLSRHATLIEKPQTPLALVTLSSLDQPNRPNRHLSELFGLTQAEAALAASVAAGRRLDDVAQERGVRISTLRTQMRAVFSKTGAKRQADLAQMITRLPMSREAE
jgi:DNA-binding CsgD family transcriptional regulator